MLHDSILVLCIPVVVDPSFLIDKQILSNFQINAVSQMDRPIGCSKPITPSPTPTTAAPVVATPIPTAKKLRTSKCTGNATCALV